MKIFLVANTDWYLYNFRNGLAQFLGDRDFEVALVSPQGAYVEKLQALGYRWLRWDVGRQTTAPWTEFSALVRLTRLYKSEQPDLVHHHTIKPVLYGTLSARWARIPAIVNSITGRGYLFLNQGVKVRWARLLVKGLYKMTLASKHTRAVFENQSDYKYFTQNGLIPQARARIIESVGVDPERFTPQPEPEGIPVILLPARMLWDKGVGVLVEAARLLHTRIKVRVVLAGAPDPGNPASIPVETLQKWQDEGVIEWWGFQEDMKAMYAKSNVVTLPSYGEGVPTSLLEAAACGRPIVTTDIPGCRDFVTDGYNGLLVPTNDPIALSTALEKLMVVPALRSKMGAAGRQRVLERYTNELVNSATLSVYRELVP